MQHAALGPAYQVTTAVSLLVSAASTHEPGQHARPCPECTDAQCHQQKQSPLEIILDKAAMQSTVRSHASVPADEDCRSLLVCCLLWVSTHCSCIAHCFLHTAPQWVSYNGGLSRAGVKASLGLSLCHRGLVDLCTSKLNTECAPHILPTAVMKMHANTHSSGPQNPRLALKDIVSLPSRIREHASRTVVATCMRRHG